MTGELLLRPVVSWPRQARPGERHLVTVDLRPVAGADWPYDGEEEIVVHCALRAGPLFTSRPVGTPALVVHRFGGTYRPARFVLTARERFGVGSLTVTLVNDNGVTMSRLELDSVEVVDDSLHVAEEVMEKLDEAPVAPPPLAPRESPPPIPASRPRRDSVRLDLGDIQGDILRGYGSDYPEAVYAFLRIKHPDVGRAWLGRALDRVTSAAPWTEHKPRSTLNLAVTAEALAALGVSRDAIWSFGHEFRQGMESRASLLGDTGGSDPSSWEPGLQAAHVLVTIKAQRAQDIRVALDEVVEAAHYDGVSVVHVQEASLLPSAHDHFGYAAAGGGQPAIEGVSEMRSRGGGVPLARGGWRPLAPGEFVLGYPDEETRVDRRRRLPDAPAHPLGRSGTYMVWRKLYQDVALFRRTVRDAAARYEGGEELLAAKLVGRWPDGTPLVQRPDTADSRADLGPGAEDFRYDMDSDGLRCPIDAHIRRANPRSTTGIEFRRRMLRRGMPYGPPLPEAMLDDDGADRGLVFVCFVASISRQYESLQVQSLRDDFLTSRAARARMVVQGTPPLFLSRDQPLVRARGGAYLFVPGLTALAAIADGSAG